MARRDREAAERLGQAMQVRRAELGMKRRELAAAASLSYPYVSEIENGMKDPSARALNALADALGLTAGDLYAKADGLRDVEASHDRAKRAAEGPAQRVVMPVPRVDPGHQFMAYATPPSLVDSTTLERHIEERVHAAMTDWAAAQLPRLVAEEVSKLLDGTDGGAAD